MSSGRVGQAFVLTCFFTAGYGRHRKLGVGFRTAGYGRHRSQWVNEKLLQKYKKYTCCYLYNYTSNSSHYICPHFRYRVYYVMNCTTFITKSPQNR